MSAALPSDLALRPLGPEDAAAATVVTAATDRTYLEWLPAGWEPIAASEERARIRRALAEPGAWAVGAFERGGRMVAFATARRADEEDADGRPRGHLVHLFVHPDRWRQGIAAALLQRAEEEMLRQGFREAVLWTPRGAPATCFYLSMGWKRNGSEAYIEAYDLQMIGFSRRLA
ncbi:MAG: GNAT family N-acetyltransferase [Solirubrobacterales bacterium]